jgi:DNA-binding Xre family transcriptional regulator
MSKAKPKSDCSPITEQLRGMIANSGMTLNALAVAAGVPQPVLHRFVSGVRENIRLDTAGKLCQFFGARLTAPRWPKGRKGTKT